MTTIPSRLARATKTFKSPEEARQAVIQLYREWYRGAPEIVSLYSLSISPQYVRQQIRQRFEENRYVTDLRVVNQLYLQSRQEYQETMNFWKQKEHVMGKLLLPRGRPQRTFLQKFYEGRDEDQVLPAATGIIHNVP
ncbi:NADH-ubiquinone oxidoreductase Complex1 subunit [Irpex rosettiformis]|uniref:NADH-ubiquinone oxidoreductase Complex1 subunit n=1 Tax=Irpex rosettiformis TaxID=378272 RepID=A0ACB8UDP0_9APHY|nr:NADH-ubiquinone oxidoreductase Complex1 subunit [Irpex rosettiformis]